MSFDLYGRLSRPVLDIERSRTDPSQNVHEVSGVSGFYIERVIDGGRSDPKDETGGESGRTRVESLCQGTFVNKGWEQPLPFCLN